MNPFKPALLIAAMLAAPTLAQEAVVQSCGGTFAYDTAPTRAITLNQQATEVMLALGLERSMVGTAYMDDAILPQWRL